MIEQKRLGLVEVEPFIKMIENENIRGFLREALKLTPDYFWKISASSSGKYHPDWATKERGLFYHTIFSMYLASELATTFGLTYLERDIAIAACCLHDTIKYGMEYDERYYDMHPYMPRSVYGNKNNNLIDIVGKNVFNAIMSAIEAHMGTIHDGSWSSIQKKPGNTVEMVVHLADYISSRKRIAFNYSK